MKFTQQIQKTLVVGFFLTLLVFAAAAPSQETQSIGSGNRSGAAVFYVNVENTASEPDGLSWATAFPDLQSSVDLAATEGGGEVWVAQGTYTSLDSTILTMKTAVMIYGGFAGTESALAERDWNTHPVIIDGEETRRCITGADNARLDGFTITRGFTSENGAAMYNDRVSPTLMHCTFVDNHAEIQGGCIYNIYSAPTITNCIFLNNHSGERGAAIKNHWSTPTIMNCTFVGNTSSVVRGATLHSENDWPTMINSIMWDNDPLPIWGLTYASYCCIQGSLFPGESITNEDPLFMDPPHNLILSADSPCIDTGTSENAPATDILGRQRPWSGGIDMGACESVLESIRDREVAASENCQAETPDFLDSLNSPNPGMLFTQDPLPGTIRELGAHPVTITMTDEKGDTRTTTAQLFVVDDISPVVQPIEDQILSSGNSCQIPLPNLSHLIDATDNCSATENLIITQIPPASSMRLFPLGDIDVTMTVTDEAGNYAEQSFVVSVIDDQAPRILEAPALEAPASADCKALIPDFTTRINVKDNCTAKKDLIIEQSPEADTPVSLGTHEITITVTDQAGNTTTDKTTFTVFDNIKPILISPLPDQVATVDGNCLHPIPDFIESLVASDNCTTPEDLLITQEPEAGIAVGLGEHTIRVTVTDEAGNTLIETATFTVIDEISPLIEAIPAQQVSADENCQALIPDFRKTFIATDNCTPSNRLTIEQNPKAGVTAEVGTHTITITVTDAAGNSTEDTTTFTVTEGLNPVIESIADLQTSADENCQAEIPDYTDHVVATDNCTDSDKLLITQEPEAGTLVGPGEHTVAITVSDEAENRVTATTKFTVVDESSPMLLEAIADQEATVDSNCQASVPNFITGIKVADNCTESSALMVTQQPQVGTAVGVGTHEITVIVKDEAGNTLEASAFFTVLDSLDPVIAFVANHHASVDGNCQAEVPDFTSGVIASANCTASEDLLITQFPTVGTIMDSGVHRVTITVTDKAGNTATKDALFTVSDGTSPVIEAIEAQQVAVNKNCQTTVPDFTKTVIASDNCTDPAELAITQSPTVGTIVPAGIHEVMVTVTDKAGNMATQNARFTAFDDSSPVLAPIADQQAAVDASCQAKVPDFTENVIASDNCTESTALNITQNPAAGTLVSAGTHEVTVTVTDEMGNMATQSASFIAFDDSSPIIDPTADQLAAADANCQAQVPDFKESLTVADNCTARESFLITQQPEAGTTLPPGYARNHPYCDR